jgi:prophage regulatory protein
MSHSAQDETPYLPPAETVPPARLLRLPEVMARVGLRRSAIYQRMSEGRFQGHDHSAPNAPSGSRWKSTLG